MVLHACRALHAAVCEGPRMTHVTTSARAAILCVYQFGHKTDRAAPRIARTPCEDFDPAELDSQQAVTHFCNCPSDVVPLLIELMRG